MRLPFVVFDRSMSAMPFAPGGRNGFRRYQGFGLDAGVVWNQRLDGEGARMALRHSVQG
jgi:hypothetical protein